MLLTSSLMYVISWKFAKLANTFGCKLQINGQNFTFMEIDVVYVKMKNRKKFKG